MKCKLQRIAIPDTHPFLNCKLDREKYASVLKTIVLTYREGCVLAVNGKWGTGKTTFVEMWAKYLELDNIHTLYFNAWENDFISDPIVGLLGELKKISSQKQTEDALLSVINTAGKIVLKAAPAIIRGVLKKYAGEEVIDVCTDSIEEGASLLKKEIDNYEEQKFCLKQFQADLTKFVEDVCGEKPLVFIVDELDRCNPNYAVRVLERIKHLFSIPNIVFVLSIDKNQLSNSIRGYYGSDLIDSEEYLKRFIDIEYSLPQPNVDKFCNYLYEYYEFRAFFGTKERNEYFSRDDESESFLKISQALFKHKKLTLRQIEKIFGNTRLSLKMFAYNNYVYPDLLFLLTYFRLCESSLYEKICNREYNAQELINQIELIIPKYLLKKHETYGNHSSRFILFTIARLLECYNCDENGITHEKLMTDKVQNEDRTLTFTVQTIDQKTLIDALDWMETRQSGNFSLSHILNKINLLENFRN